MNTSASFIVCGPRVFLLEYSKSGNLSPFSKLVDYWRAPYLNEETELKGRKYCFRDYLH